MADVTQAQLRFTEFAQQWARLRAEVQNAKAEQDAAMMEAGHMRVPSGITASHRTGFDCIQALVIGVDHSGNDGTYM